MMVDKAPAVQWSSHAKSQCFATQKEVTAHAAKFKVHGTRRDNPVFFGGGFHGVLTLAQCKQACVNQNARRRLGPKTHVLKSVPGPTKYVWCLFVVW